MSDIAVRVENLGKCYQIGQAKSGDLRESFGSWLDKLQGRSNGRTAENQEFWALKDINFEIKKGEAVGIIGRNGAGKSTLLKILSRITEPTKGRFEINGRVSSLLEVGTGFHPELSGRENIYLNGTILGMKRQEIKARFDEIVAFSGVENFIDTPVKHYSSGMKVRLAFSVAAYLEPEILIIDEVLAVGDAEFQKKCLGKMDEVSKKEGRTVIFVSHNMGAVETLCSKGIFLEQSTINIHGDISSVVSHYLRGDMKLNYANKCIDYRLNDQCQIQELWISNDNIVAFDSIEYKIVLKSNLLNPVSELAFLFYNEHEERIAIIDLRHEQLMRVSKMSDTVTVKGKITGIPFIEGEYQLGLYLASNHCTGNFLNLIQLNVLGKSSLVAPYTKKVRGHLELINEFKIYV